MQPYAHLSIQQVAPPKMHVVSSMLHHASPIGCITAFWGAWVPVTAALAVPDPDGSSETCR